MASQMPVVNVEFGDRPAINSRLRPLSVSLKVVELLEGNGHGSRGDTVTVNYHGVVWVDAPFDSSFDRHQPASAAQRVGQVIKVGTRPFRGTTSVPAWWYPFRRNMAMVPWRSATSIGGEDTLMNRDRHHLHAGN